MKLGPLIAEVKILYFKLHDSRPPQANFFEKWYFFVSGLCNMHFLYDNTKILSANFGFPLNSKFLATHPF